MSTIKLSQYTPPGVLIQEEPVSAIPAALGLPRRLCLIGEGNPAKNYNSEQHRRGYVTQEPAGTTSSTLGPVTTLTGPTAGGKFATRWPSDLKVSSMFLYKNGDLQDPSTFTVTALIDGAPGVTVGASGNVDVGSHAWIVTDLVNGVETPGTLGTVTAISATAKQVTVDLTSVPVPPGSSLRYIYRTKIGAPSGTAYRVGSAAINSTSFVDNVADASLGAQNPPTSTGVTVVTIAPYDGSAAYTFSYQSLTSVNVYDELLGDTRGKYATVGGVGTFPGTANFIENTDYEFFISGSGTVSTSGTAVTGTFSKFLSEVAAGDVVRINGEFRTVTLVTSDTAMTIDSALTTTATNVAYKILDSFVKWITPAAAKIVGSVAGPFDFTVSGGLPKTLIFTADGGSTTTVTFQSSDFVSPSAATHTEVRAKINTIFGSTIAINPSPEDNKIYLTSLTTGSSSSIQIGSGTANAILGFQDGALATGAGKSPAQGEEYFISYTGVRPSTDFNTPILTTSYDQLIAGAGAVSSTNALALAGAIVYDQRPPLVYFVQVKNTGTGIAAQDLDYITAIKAAELNPDLTDIVVLGHPVTVGGGTKALIRQNLRQHVTQQSGLLAKAERMGWFGMPIGSTVGDAETPGTFIYVATQELQVASDSPGRGRFVLNGPSWVKRTYRFPDGTAKQLKLDSTYLAAGVAALECALPSPSDALLRREVVGFDDVESWSVGDRNLAANNGVNLTALRGAIFVQFDPVTTETTSAEFREINVMAQKDHVAKRVRKEADDTLVGIVPDDLAQFIFEIKSTVGKSLNAEIADGAIGPFQDANGNPRRIDLRNDVIAQQRASDPTTYDFNYTFFPKFVAKRLFGVYSVTIPSGV